MKRSLLYWCCLGLILIGGCIKFFDPVSPSWDMTLNIPLVDKTYTIQDIINNNPSIFSTNGNGILLYSTSSVIKPIYIQNSLTVTDQSFPFESWIGPFTVQDASTTSNDLWLERLVPEMGPLNGTTATVPSISFQFNNDPMPSVEEFHQVTVVGGTLTVEVKNNFPVPIQQLTLTFYDQFRSDYGDLAFAQFNDPIPAHGSASCSFPLTERTIGNMIRYDVSGTVGASTKPVLIDANSQLAATLRFTDVTVTKAEARIPETLWSTSKTVILDDSSSIDRAVIRSGRLAVHAKVPFDGSGAITVQVPNLTTQSGQQFSHYFMIKKKQSTIDTVFSLDDYILRAPDHRINYEVDTRIDSTPHDYIFLDASDSITGTITISDIILKSFEGIIKPTDVPVEQNFILDTKAINKLVAGTVSYTDASLIIHLQTPAQGFDYDLYGSVLGCNRRTRKTNTFTIQAGQKRYNPGTDSVVFNKSDLIAFLNGFSPNLPDSLSLRMTALINPAGTRHGVVYDTDGISGKAGFVLPFRLSIKGGVYRDTLSIDAGSGAEDILRVRLNLSLENWLPTSLSIDSVIFLDNKGRPLFMIPKQEQPQIAVGSGTVVDEVVTQPGKNTTYAELTSTETSLLDESENILLYMRLDTPAADPVRFRSTDGIKFVITSTVDYRANK